MRLNKFLALYGGLSRRSADRAIEDGRVRVNAELPKIGQSISDEDKVSLDGTSIQPVNELQTIMLNKPAGYVCSRDGQGNKTIYELLPPELHDLKPVGRLDKHSSGLLLLTNDGDLAYKLTHPKFEKTKKYRVRLDKYLSLDDEAKVTGPGVLLDDGPSKLKLVPDNDRREWFVTMHEGRNRQIRRTFESLGYQVYELHRLGLGDYKLGSLATGQYQTVANWTKNRYNVVNE